MMLQLLPLIRPVLHTTQRQYMSLTASPPVPFSSQQRFLLFSPVASFRPSHTQELVIRTMMAGHNKWSKIRHKKGANDVKKALVLGKASKSLTIVSKECKGDRSDPRLQAAIQHAKSAKLPKDRIEDAIVKGTVTKGALGGSDQFFPLRFDAMMRLEHNHHHRSNNSDAKRSNGASASSPSSSSISDSSVQVACIITALSDNRNRTTQNIRHLVNKHGGEFLPTDHLNYLFEKVGHIEVEPKNRAGFDGKDVGIEDFEERLIECALEAGATNVEPVGREEEDEANTDSDKTPRFVVTTEESDLWKVVRALRLETNDGTTDGDAVFEQEGGVAHSAVTSCTVVNCEHRHIPREEYGVGTAEVVTIRSGSEAHEGLGEFLDRLDEDEDVHKVYHNALLE